MKRVKEIFEQEISERRIESLKETGGKKSVQLITLMILTLASQLLKTFNQSFFDFIVNFFVLVFVALLAGSFIFQNTRDKKLRQVLASDFELQLVEERKKWESTCNACAQSNESLIFEMKNAFDSALAHKEEQFQVVIASYQEQIGQAVELFLEEKRKFDRLLAQLSGVRDSYDYLLQENFHSEKKEESDLNHGAKEPRGVTSEQ